jgi:tRNA pseudouridine32 synthase/23S rRNA pseudouridine746 synthase
MSSLGFQILNDKYYPNLQPKSPDIFSKPLQLVAKHLSFIDPVSHKPFHFESSYNLKKLAGENL